VKLHADNLGDVYAIVAYGPDYVQLRRGESMRKITTSVVILPHEVLEPWATQALAHTLQPAQDTHEKGISKASPDLFSEADFAPIAQAHPEIVLVGTGSKLRFPHPRVFAPLRQANIGFEVMDTQAACRTYNILLAESRKVAAALLFGM
jgi:uncharacterized protein